MKKTYLNNAQRMI